MQIFMNPIFMNYSPNCISKKLGMTNIILESFCSFFNWDGANIQAKIRPRKTIGICILQGHAVAHKCFL